MRRKTYSEAMLENLHKKINYWQEQARILREERDRERLRNEAITASFEKMVKEVEEKNKTICQLTNKMLTMKEES